MFSFPLLVYFVGIKDDIRNHVKYTSILDRTLALKQYVNKWCFWENNELKNLRFIIHFVLHPLFLCWFLLSFLYGFVYSAGGLIVIVILDILCLFFAPIKTTWSILFWKWCVVIIKIGRFIEQFSSAKFNTIEN